MIHFSNTVSDPWTVMVHPQNAFLTNGTVMNSFLFDNVTLKAIQDQS